MRECENEKVEELEVGENIQQSILNYQFGETLEIVC